MHIALLETLIDDAVASVMEWREVRLASLPAELLTGEPPRDALAAHLVSKGIAVGVLAGTPLPASAFAAAAE